MSLATSQLSAYDFGQLPDPGHPQELVRGAIISMPPPKPRHNQVCGNVYYLLRSFAEAQQLGHVLPGDTGIITERDPDTVRGMDVAFISYAKLPPGPLPKSYLDVPPDAVFEVRSPGNRWVELHKKVSEYLVLGVPAVYVADVDQSRVHCFYPDEQDILDVDDQFVGVGPLAGFRVPVSRFFE
jgi:Uma2 family endonuclease